MQIRYANQLTAQIRDCRRALINTFGAGIYPGYKAAAQAALVDAAVWEGYATKLEIVIAGCR